MATGEEREDPVISSEQQEIWRRERATRGLDPRHEGFGREGVMRLLDAPGVGVTVLTGEPGSPWLDLEPELANVLPNAFQGYTANGVSHLSSSTTTSSMLIKYATGAGGGPWRGYVAMRVDGGVEVGIGATVRYQLTQPAGYDEPVVAYRLPVLVHAIRVAIRTQSELLLRIAQSPHHPPELAPFELDVAIPDTGGAVLTAFNEGWAPPEHDFGLVRALEPDVLVRLQVERWPLEADDERALLFHAADRVCRAFGRDERLYVVRQGPGAGQMAVQYA